MRTAAQHNKSANKNKYKILRPFDAIAKAMMDKQKIKYLDNFK